MLKNKVFSGPKLAVFLLLFAGLFLSACGGQVASSNWPGLATGEDGMVYVSYGQGVVAVDVNEQSQLWNFTDVERRSPIFAPAYYQDGTLFFGDYGATGGFLNPRVRVSVYSLSDVNTDNPATEWKQSEHVQDKVIAQPLVVGDRIFVGTNDNRMVALDASNGAQVWAFETEHSIWGSPTYEDGVLYVPSLDKYVYALKAQTGDLLWKTNVGGSVSDKVAINEGTLYAGSFDNNLYALNKEDGSTLWTAASQAPIWGAPAYADGVVYAVDISGNVMAVSAESGEVIWTNDVAGYVVAAVVLSDEVLYVASAGNPDLAPNERNGSLVALDLETGEKLWERQTDLPIFSTPVIVEGSIITAMNGQNVPLLLEGFDVTDPDRNWTFTPTIEQS